MAAGPSLTRQLLALALPVFVEHMLHIAVGVTDTYLANHLEKDAAPATAAVGSITYFLWFFGLITAAIGTGSTAIIARAIGARHRRLANNVCGQSIAAAALLGLGLALVLFLAATPICAALRLTDQARDMAEVYLRMLAWSLPFTTVMFVGGSCLRGAGDTITPALTMICIDLVNAVCTFALCRGWWGLPEMGFIGIAAGTVIAYITGGVLMVIALLRGRGGIRLFIHRLSPHWHTLRRILRIGIPTGMGDFVQWLANIGVLVAVNRLGDVAAAAHINAIRIESFSFMSGFAFSIAAATMVGQSLGMKDPRRAMQSANLAYAWGGGFMIVCGIGFVIFAQVFADWISGTPEVARQTARCLMLAGFVQCGFAAAAVFGGALRGAGDTAAVMVLSLLSILCVRFVGVLVVGIWLDLGLTAIWLVLVVELMVRGSLIYGRFLQGKWKQIEV